MIHGFAKPLGSCSTFVAECQGAICGLHLAWELGFKNVHFESDSSSLVHSILNSNHIDHYLINIIKKMLLQNWR